jgi:hypothetical protein
MKHSHIKLLVVLLLAVASNISGQGFVNLDFESAIIVNDPQGSYPWSVYGSDAIPGWTAYIAGTPVSDIWYNEVPLGAPEVTLQGTNNILGRPLIGGNYFVMLWGAFNNPTGGSAAIGQTGEIPSSAQSLVFWGTTGGLQVTFNGQPLFILTTGSTANYTIYAADISAYAGQTGQLLFTDPYYSNTQGGPASIDNIQFSSSSVPEPSVLSLFSICILLFCWRTKRPNNSPEPTPIARSVSHSRLTRLAARLSFCR